MGARVRITSPALTMKTNLQLEKTVRELKRASKKEQVNLWRRVSEELERPTRSMRAVNLSKIERCCRDGEVALVPGKVLATGSLKKSITVAAWKFSKGAQEKISKAGKALSLAELMKKNPKGKNVRIIG